MNEVSQKGWVWVAVAAILAVALVVSSSVVSNGIVKAKGVDNVITVTGSAKEQIKSDLVFWSGSFSAQSPTLAAAYVKLRADQVKVAAYLKRKGIAEKDMVFNSINTTTNYVQLPNGQYSNQIDSYRLMQQVEISSDKVDEITVISREATELINEGVEFQSNSPNYYYTKLAEKKIDMLAKATADARQRAEKIAENAKSDVGKLRSARQGVFQIMPLYSESGDMSDSGTNDTSSLNKEIMAVVSCSFEVD
ncbi:MAG: SIMPL domain-containing protein [Candidatus Saccharibacteria bacterium]